MLPKTNKETIQYVNVTDRRASIIQNFIHFIHHGHENTDSDRYHKYFINYFLMGPIKNTGEQDYGNVANIVDKYNAV
jgi:hypothetical protein